MSRVYFSHCYCRFKGRAFFKELHCVKLLVITVIIVANHQAKKPRTRDTQRITDVSAQTNQLQMEVSGDPLALEPDEFTETNVLKEATRSCPTQDQCAGDLCARSLRKPNANSWPPSFPAHSSLEGLPLPTTAAGEHKNRTWRFTFDTLVEIASQGSAELHAQVADEQQGCTRTPTQCTRC